MCIRDRLRRVLREEKVTVAEQTDSSQETGLPDGMLGFLDALMDESNIPSSIIGYDVCGAERL